MTMTQNRGKVSGWTNGKLRYRSKNPARWDIRLKDALNNLGVKYVWLTPWKSPDGYLFQWTAQVWYDNKPDAYAFIEFFGSYQTSGGGTRNKAAIENKENVCIKYGRHILWLKRKWVGKKATQSWLQKEIIIFLRACRWGTDFNTLDTTEYFHYT